jgi:hypothetical protein
VKVVRLDEPRNDFEHVKVAELFSDEVINDDGRIVNDYWEQGQKFVKVLTSERFENVGNDCFFSLKQFRVQDEKDFDQTIETLKLVELL